ncbi:hypothetical protein [Simkania sp.]|uniref:hypothetical protein n=1 Tax=Simkania sp. TaxID=34094 RepID=UPI003B51A2B4
MATLANTGTEHGGGVLACVPQFKTWTYSHGRGSEIVISGDAKELKAIWVKEGSYTPLFSCDLTEPNWNTIKDLDAYLQKYFPTISWQWDYLVGIVPYRKIPSVTFTMNTLYQVHVKFSSKSVSLEVAFFDTGHAVKHRLINRLRDLKLWGKPGYEFCVLEYNSKTIGEDEYFGTHAEKSETQANIIPKYYSRGLQPTEMCSWCEGFFNQNAKRLGSRSC